MKGVLEGLEEVLEEKETCTPAQQWLSMMMIIIVVIVILLLLIAIVIIIIVTWQRGRGGEGKFGKSDIRGFFNLWSLASRISYLQLLCGRVTGYTKNSHRTRPPVDGNHNIFCHVIFVQEIFVHAIFFHVTLWTSFWSVSLPPLEAFHHPWSSSANPCNTRISISIVMMIIKKSIFTWTE